MCGYTYWKNPHDFTNQSFEFVGNIMKQIDATAKEKTNFITQVATVHKDTGKEVVKISFWTGVYDCETAQETPFERIEQLKKEIEILKSQINK